MTDEDVINAYEERFGPLPSPGLMGLSNEKYELAISLLQEAIDLWQPFDSAQEWADALGVDMPPDDAEVSSSPNLVAQWNTGRLYQRDGQRIGAELVGDTVLFRDYSRMIDGEFKCPAPLPATPLDLQVRTMAAYDHMNYKMSSQASRLRWKE